MLKIDLEQQHAEPFRSWIDKEFPRGAAICVGVDMTGEMVKVLLLILMFGGLEAAMRLQPVVLKRRSRQRRVRH